MRSLTVAFRGGGALAHDTNAKSGATSMSTANFLQRVEGMEINLEKKDRGGKIIATPIVFETTRFA
jgi:hypothetical protein